MREAEGNMTDNATCTTMHIYIFIPKQFVTNRHEFYTNEQPIFINDIICFCI